MHVVDGADAENVIGRFAVAQHVENIDEHFHCRVIRAGDSLGAFDDRVNEVALAAVERFDDQRDALGLSERGEEPERLDVLLERARGGPALGNHAGTGAAHDHDRHADLAGAAKNRLGVLRERGGIDGGADDFEARRQQAVCGGHRQRTRSKRGGVSGEGGIVGKRQEKLLHVALDEIETVRNGQGGERGGVEAEADLHGR